MKDTFAFTLYELFGYLIPGWIGGAALCLLLWAIFGPDAIFPLTLWRISTSGWAGLFFIAYLLGHAVQALGNLLLKTADNRILSDDDNPFVKHAKERAAILSKTSGAKLKNVWLYRVMDEHCLQHGHPGDRDMFTYREGFYRGVTVSTVLFAIGLVTRLIAGTGKILVGKMELPISRIELALSVLVAALIGWAFYQRFQRFSEFRVSRVIVAFLALSASGHPAEKGKEASGQA